MAERVPDNTETLDSVTTKTGFRIDTLKNTDGSMSLAISHRLDQMVDMAMRLFSDTRLLAKLSARTETASAGRRILVSRCESLVTVHHRHVLVKMLNALDQSSAVALYSQYQQN